MFVYWQFVLSEEHPGPFQQAIIIGTMLGICVVHVLGWLAGSLANYKLYQNTRLKEPTDHPQPTGTELQTKEAPSSQTTLRAECFLVNARLFFPALFRRFGVLWFVDGVS